ncbi:hypothetical protein NT05LM_0256, partial [Listeria marthii FSL S4-120]
DFFYFFLNNSNGALIKMSSAPKIVDDVFWSVSPVFGKAL